jgi:hypothetical protein
VVLIAGVVNVLPVPIGNVLVGSAYHSIDAPAEAVAFKLTVPVPQRLAGTVVATVGLFTVNATEAEVTASVPLQLITTS